MSGPWQVGDDVIMSWGDRLRRAKIARVMAKFVELDDGSKWDPGAFGNPYPRHKERFYSGPSIRRPIESDTQDLLKQQLSRYVDKDFLKKCDLVEMRCLEAALVKVASWQKKRSQI